MGIQREAIVDTARNFIAFLAGVLLAGAAAAQFPGKPIRLVVPFPAGGGADLSARSVAAPLAQALGQQVLIDNKPGADGQIAALEVKRAAPDGYTIFWGSASSLSAVPAMRKVPPYDAIADFTPLASLGNFIFLLTVHPSVPAATAGELVAHLRANPGKLNYGSANVTSIVAMASLLVHTGSDMVHVPYKGEAQAIPDFLAGRVQTMFSTLGPTVVQAKEGKLRPLAVLLPQRSSLAPEVPTMAEAGYPLVSIAPWAGFVGPAGMPVEIAQRFTRELNAALARPEVRDQHDKIGVSLRLMSQEAFAAFLREQLVTWRNAIRAAKLPQE
jgi:tripartite-type tricarboxylate transporter receptor subunit TctC